MRSCLTSSLTQESVDTPRARPAPPTGTDDAGQATTGRPQRAAAGTPRANDTRSSHASRAGATRATHPRLRSSRAFRTPCRSALPASPPLGAAPPVRSDRSALALTPVAGGRARALPLQEYVHAVQPRRHTTCVQMGETETQPKGLAATMHPGRRRRARFPARGGRVARARSLRRARGRASRAVCSRCTSLVDSSPRHSHDSALAWRAACAHCRHARAQAGLKRDRVSFCAFTHAASPPF